MAKLKKGQKMVCIPCAREVIISNAGVSRTTLWCCGRPMQQKAKATSKRKTTRKTAKNKALRIFKKEKIRQGQLGSFEKNGMRLTGRKTHSMKVRTIVLN